MTSWLAAAGIAVVMVLVAVVPSYFWLRATRVPSFIAAVFAPAVTIALLVGLGYAYGALGVFWSGARVIPVLLLIGLAGSGAFWLRVRSAKLAGSALPSVTPAWGPTFWAAVLVGFLLGALPLFLAGPATNPVQQWDPSFHMNGVWTINHLGDGQMGSGLDEAFREGNSSDYPLGWHIFTALFTTPTTVVLGSNASSLAVILLWVVGAAAYTRMLFPSRVAQYASPVLAGGMLSMPGDALMAYNQWPNAAAVALLPGIASMMLLLGRHIAAWMQGKGRISGGKLLWGIVGLALAIIGTLVVHPGFAFNLLVLLGPAVIAGSFQVVRVFAGQRRFGLVAGAVATFLASLVLLYRIMEMPQVRSMGEYPRSGISWLVAFGNVLTPAPPYPNSVSLAVWTGAVAALLVVGIFAVYYRSSWWPPSDHGWPTWPVWSFGAFAFLVFVAYSPDSAFREWIVAPWFLDPRRLMEPENLSMVPLAALGFSWLAHGVQRLLATRGLNASMRPLALGLAALLLMLSGGEGLLSRTNAARSVYDPDQLGKPGMATAGELKMLQGLDGKLPEGALVLGDPQNGSVYVQVIGQSRVFFPALTLSTNPTDNERLLVEEFNQINENPAVCQAVREEGITHFYADEDGYYYSRLRSDRTPGLYNVDTSTGFELVAQGDTARLYRITACD